MALSRGLAALAALPGALAPPCRAPRPAAAAARRRRPARPPPPRAAASGRPAAAAAPADVPPATAAAYARVQNGSDVRGIALELEPGEEVTLTPGMLFFIGRAFADMLAARAGAPVETLRVSVGRDPRLSSPLLGAALVAGLAAAGAGVGSFGLATTPAMFMSCALPAHAYDGAVMVTASHLPPSRNGAKFFTAAGGLGKADIKELLARAAAAAAAAGAPPADRFGDAALVVDAALAAPPGRVAHVEFLDDYAAHMRGVVEAAVAAGLAAAGAPPAPPGAPLAGLKVVVNAGNGAGGFFADQILEKLGADVRGSVNLAPDGRFPAHPANPEDARAAAATRAAVAEAAADLGVMLDTDVDRSGLVDADGKDVNRNRYIALLAAIALRDAPGATIVTDSCTSNGLAAFIASLGGRHLRYKKGYKNIIDRGVALNAEGGDCPLMMETSGHGAWRENHFLDDGAYSALKVLAEAAVRRRAGLGPVTELIAGLAEPAEAEEARFRIRGADVAAGGAAAPAAFREWVLAGAGGKKEAWRLEEENHEGWRVRVAEGGGAEGWLLVRPSLHDPDVVVNVESEVPGGVAATLAHLLAWVQSRPDLELDTAAIEARVARG